ncbi:MAG: glutamate synthase-related protein, partial [Phycisphaerae bacterium]|nr:glutamate synthase-related protein [Phycisphaerae bacterium]
MDALDARHVQGLPPPQGLYLPQFERDSCGVGFICHIRGKASHRIVSDALQMLENMNHRGACGCEPDSGDGAGIMVSMPDKFFRKEASKWGFKLPRPGEYAVAMCMLPKDLVAREEGQRILEQTASSYGMKVLGWRDVPTNEIHVGPTPRTLEPRIRQCFLAPTETFYNRADFNRRLYLVRQRTENQIEYGNVHQDNKDVFYIPVMSTNRIVYKGMLTAEQLRRYYPDLSDPDFQSHFALVHSRFSTNTFPSWRLAQPFRYLAHNGEINTLRGNRNWMRARYGSLRSEVFGDELDKMYPLLGEHTSDSATLDNMIQFLAVNGRSLPHAVLMVIPEAWQNNPLMDPERRAFYEYHACLMEPWDGPASIAFTNGELIGAVLDRNGLRPSRFYVTKDDLVIMASEVGVIPVKPEDVLRKWRLQPGKIFLIDTREGRIVDDQEIKNELVNKRPWRKWLVENLVELDSLPTPPKRGDSRRSDASKRRHDRVDAGAAGASPAAEPVSRPLLQQQHAFGYTQEDVKLLISPMAVTGQEAVGSMGTDTPLACLSEKPQLLYNYFKQLFAQVTNPPLDAIREELVTSLYTYLGREQNLLEETPDHCHLVKLKSPILSNTDLEKLRRINVGELRSVTLPMLFPVEEGESGLEAALERLLEQAAEAVADGATILILSDRGVSADAAPIPALLATAGVHHHLIRQGTRTMCGLVIETGEAREPHHFCCLIGYGAGAVNPYLAFDTIDDLHSSGMLPEGLTVETARKNYIKAVNKAILKVASKMGISTVQSYRGAQIFEAIGIGKGVIDRYFTNTASRINGIGLDLIARESLIRHRRAFPPIDVNVEVLETGGQYQWRRDGEYHMYNPDVIARLQHAVRIQPAPQPLPAGDNPAGGSRPDGQAPVDPTEGNRQASKAPASAPVSSATAFRDGPGYKVFKEYSRLLDEQARQRCTLRGLLEFRTDGTAPIDLREVEPASEIVKRFATGAMSLGSISPETHETLAIAMNRLGGKSNTGEGGEDPRRYQPDANGDLRRSAIKQVASARFGVTAEYLVNADEIQIKMAQGAKPGEGGQLPGHKVDAYIGKLRYSTPGVGLISPPPHHDIYSIEDLAQLIHDLKSVNPDARISVKLVSEVGVGTVAAGVAKAKADHILISGDSGGTGASPLTSIKHAGLPWELGLAETQQVLVLNGLRSRVRLQTDGQIKTGRDVAIAILLGAEEIGFSTAPLIAAGCVMMRVCHLNTCPVGIATQDPELRKKFAGKPEHIINFMFFVAEELREIMAQLGFRTVDEMVGRVDRLTLADVSDHWKARHVDLSPILYQPKLRPGDAPRCTTRQDHGLERSLDHTRLLKLAEPAIAHGTCVSAEMDIRNIHRCVGATLSGRIARKYGDRGLPPDTIHFKFNGSAGQSFGAFLARGVTLELEGDANDYVGKGCSGGRIIIYPPRRSDFRPEENIIAGNVIAYGATGGELYLRGVVGERFCVRNSGAIAVVEGVGDHGCEYMT